MELYYVVNIYTHPTLSKIHVALLSIKLLFSQLVFTQYISICDFSENMPFLS